MDLVDEQHVARVAVREDRGEVARSLDCRTARDPDLYGHLVRDAVRGRGLADARRAVEEHVLERLLPELRRVELHAQLRLHRVLVDVVGVVEGARPERQLERALLVARLRRGEALLRHAFASASRSWTIARMSATAFAIGRVLALVSSRDFSSTPSCSSVRRLTVRRSGRPMRSASANFTPAVSSRSSYSTSTPAAWSSRSARSAAARTRSSECGSVTRC